MAERATPNSKTVDAPPRSCGDAGIPPRLTAAPIDVEQLRCQVGSELAGAVVVFVGTTRSKTGDQITERLEYEAHGPMATASLTLLQEEAVRRFSLQGCGIVHRLGVVEVGQASVAIAVSSPHRRDAFAATAWLMDRIKSSVPIWKREHAADGSLRWVHGEERPGP